MLRSLMYLGLLALPVLATAPVAAQDMDYSQRFRVFTGRGEPATLADVVRSMANVDVVYVGETHTDPVGHWLEAELLRGALDLARGSARPTALSLEMFERDVQGIVDEYLQGLITEDQFTRSARAWDYYRADYRPMVELAKTAGIPVIAANAPRRYVNRVSRLGRDALGALSEQARTWLPPLPYPPASEAYRSEWVALMSDMPMQRPCGPPSAASPLPGHAAADSAAAMPQPTMPPAAPAAGAPSHMASFMENGLQAQSLWDATMAQAITRHLERTAGALVLHMVGGFHVQNFTGTPEQVKHYRPATRSLVVSMEPVADIGRFDPAEHAGQGDFVILTDASLDLDYERRCGVRPAAR